MSPLFQNPQKCICVLVSGFISMVAAAAIDLPVKLQVDGKTQEIQRYSQDDLTHSKLKSGREKRPGGENLAYSGPSLQNLVDEALAKVPLNVRAQIDLVVLEGDKREALIPRSYVNKFPVVISKTKTGFESVAVGWQTNSKIKAEEVPVTTYFLDSVQGINLTSYRERYSAYFLKRRTDPAAMRGEKIFTQACLSCHATGIGPDPTKWTTVEVGGMKKNPHRTQTPAFELNDKMIRALVSYWSSK